MLCRASLCCHVVSPFSLRDVLLCYLRFLMFRGPCFPGAEFPVYIPVVLPRCFRVMLRVALPMSVPDARHVLDELPARTPVFFPRS